MDASRFANLSPELRNMIYELALYERRPVAISPNRWTEPPLTVASKQIRIECLHLFYSINDFAMLVRVPSPAPCQNHRWFKTVALEKPKLIKSLTVRLEGCWPYCGQEIDYLSHNDVHDLLYQTSLFWYALKRCNFGPRSIEQVVKIKFNSGDDAKPSEKSRPDDYISKLYLHLLSCEDSIISYQSSMVGALLTFEQRLLQSV